MTPTPPDAAINDPDVTIYHGDARHVLHHLEPESVHTVVTSPPFWMLRDYGTATWEGGDPTCDHVERWSGKQGAAGSNTLGRDATHPNRHTLPTTPGTERQPIQFRDTCDLCGARRIDQQIGLEATPAAWIDALVDVFRGVHRVLRSDGTAWVEIGDTYVSYNANRGASASLSASADDARPAAPRGLPGSRPGARPGRGGDVTNAAANRNGSPGAPGLKAKDMVLAPFRLARALQEPYYTGAIRRETDRVWLAAIIDGEGHIGVHRRPAGQRAYAPYRRADGSEAEYVRKADTFTPVLEVTNTSRAIIDRVAAITGEGGSHVKQEAGTNGRKQTLYRWSVQGDKAREVLREVYPHLIGKAQQARLVVALASSGQKATATWEAVKALHQGESTPVDAPAPASMFEPGWYVRSIIVWRRPNPMPESATDRPTTAHTYVLLLSKKPRYFYDGWAIRTPAANDPNAGGRQRKLRQQGQDASFELWQDRVAPQAPVAEKRRTVRAGVDVNGGGQGSGVMRFPVDSANARTVWTIPPGGSEIPHYAMFPPELVRRCIAAGSSEHGCCPCCGAPWRRVIDRPETFGDWRRGAEVPGDELVNRQPDGLSGEAFYDDWTPGEFKGWERTCTCMEVIAGGADLAIPKPVPCTILDPFMGTGTVALVARQMGRRAVGVELSEEYLGYARSRLAQLSLLA